MLRIAGRPLPIVGRARVYVCGITPYDTTHLGHAATFVWADVAARVLRHLGVDIEVCRNVTDVDDVLDAAAARSGSRADSFAAVQQFRFDRDMAALGVRRPTHEPRARSHVGQVVTLAAALVALGAAYEVDGTVWFRGAGLAERAGLSAATADALAAEFNQHPDPQAEHPADVARLAAGARGGGGVAEPVGRGTSRLARRVRGDGADDARAPPSTCTWAAPICATRTTPTRRRWPRRSPVWRRSRGRGCTSAPSGSTARRWPRAPATSCSCPTCWPSTPPRALRLLLVDRPWAQAVGVRPGRARRRHRPAGAALRRRRPRRARHGHGRGARRHRRPPRRPRRAPRPRHRRGGGRRGGAGRAVGARPDLSERGVRRPGAATAAVGRLLSGLHLSGRLGDRDAGGWAGTGDPDEGGCARRHLVCWSRRTPAWRVIWSHLPALQRR